MDANEGKGEGPGTAQDITQDAVYAEGRAAAERREGADQNPHSPARRNIAAGPTATPR